jgi:hypothetical protein
MPLASLEALLYRAALIGRQVCPRARPLVHIARLPLHRHEPQLALLLRLQIDLLHRRRVQHDLVLAEIELRHAFRQCVRDFG